MSKMENKKIPADYLFEVSWEVCNKVGGIHTVVATKAQTVHNQMGDNYILIGPDTQREGINPEFNEDPELLKNWKQILYNEGIRIRVGRWNIKGNPIAVLVDFSSLFSQKDKILQFMWETYRVDSISGQWDYIEPVLFGYAAGKVIESYIDNYCTITDSCIAHFHEWMTSSGGLYLRKYMPYVATVFTTHATVMGRCIAGNGMKLYSGLGVLNSDELARRFNVVAKHSLEKLAATYHDAFLTVSDITANESKHLLGKEVDTVTPNGFENDFVWQGKEFDEKRSEARKAMIEVAEACLGHKFTKEPFIVGTSGRYEFKNKGLDVFVESLKKLAEDPSLDREVLAYITVPAGNYGPRKDLQAYLADNHNTIDASQFKYTTHYLENINWDPVVSAMNGSILMREDSKVKVIFVPSYLQGADGIFNKHYYELLVGMDATVFASYYEPWGYTPLESIAFGVPTITTSLAGFGAWAEGEKDHKGVVVVDRNDTNDEQVIESIASNILSLVLATNKEMTSIRKAASKLSEQAAWSNFINYYIDGYKIAMENAAARATYSSLDGGAHTEQINFVRQQLSTNTPNWTRMMVEKNLPERLRPLELLSKNLWWSWTLNGHELFKCIDPDLWTACYNNPIEFLDRLSYDRLKELEQDQEYLAKMDAVWNDFQAYMAEKKEAKAPKIAYFSMEYGLHSSLKIYSGGLGILAGDYIKEASDKNVQMVAVGLLYRYGYFTQKLSNFGEQEATYEAQNFYKLPISPVRNEDGSWVSIQVAMPGRMVTARIWKCEVGRTDLYLLDTDHDLNLAEDRSITHHLYGGDWENRLKQELLLGIGGIRALRAVGIKQEVYHCNEGHAAFIGIERIRELIATKHLSFSEALEVIRSSSLFTTHTPVPAGHDAFPEGMIRQYMSHFPDRLGITWEQFINLGKTNPNDPNEKFSMSVLACNLSQEVNGVSWLHGEVSKKLLGNMWPGYFTDELHIGYVTNGVHFPTWTATSLKKLYLKYFPEGFSGHQYQIPAWQKVHNIPDEELWSTRIALKQRLLKTINRRLADPTQVRFDNPAQAVKIRETMKAETLTIGFARRFATYKRAYLLFTNLERLSAIVNNKERPVQFLFAGKAHPNDKPGQDLIKRIVEVSNMPEFVGKILFLQNYDMELARRMVQGVDVWLNNPTRPLEASGTSGEKCVMNGVMQFSVLDGWWVEGYKEGAGWMLPMERTYQDQKFQDELDAELIYNTIEEQIVPLYYNSRNANNVPTEWVHSLKKCVADIASNFTTNRMLTDYEERFYHKLAARKAEMKASNFAMAREMAAWKRHVSSVWDMVKIVDVKKVDIDKEAIYVGGKYHIEVTVDIANLRPEDIGAEFVIASQIENGQNVKVVSKQELSFVKSEGTLATYATEIVPEHTGSYDSAIRVFPKNDKLPHRMDFALVKWA